MQMKKYKNIELEMRRLLALFAAMTLFVAPVFSQKKDVYKVQTVVIDPGHGGAKPGARGAHIMEKELTLSIAKKFGKLISDNYPDVRVIYTRTTDVDISLAERAHIANRNKADLFVSIHINSHPTSIPTGVETFVMGLSESRANLEVAKKENADILLEADYKSNEAYKDFDPNAPESYVMLAMYQNAFIDKSLNFAQAIQNQYKKNLKTINRGVKQAELFVLYKTTCPSVLTEVGFISNPTEEAFMMSDEGQAKLAVCLFNAFMTFKATEEGTNKIANPKIDLPGYVAPTATVPAAPAVVADSQEEPQKEPQETPQETPQAEPQPESHPEPQPVEENPVVAEAPVAPQPQPQPAPTLQAPDNTAVSATEFYTVQFLTSDKELREGDPAFMGIENVMTTRNGQLYCYSVGRFSTFTEADEYCARVRRTTPFKDAWAVRRTTVPAPAPVAPKAPVVSGAPKQTKATEEPKAAKVASTPAPKPEPKPRQLAADDKGTHYRIQIFSATRLLKAGDPELQGIKDFRYSRSGKFYVYSCGNYTSLAEARKRLASIRKNTSFKDAFLFGIKDGKRFKVD